jgi:hypothetical protein
MKPVQQAPSRFLSITKASQLFTTERKKTKRHFLEHKKVYRSLLKQSISGVIFNQTYLQKKSDIFITLCIK